MEAIIALIIVIGIVSWLNNAVNNVKEKQRLKKEIEKERQEVIKEKDLIEKEKKNTIELKKDIENLKKDITQNSPWLAEKLADCYTIYDIQKENYLKNKSHPAYKASEIVAEVKEEKRKLLKDNRMLNYQLKLLCDSFPFVENFIQEDLDNYRDAIEYINQPEVKDEYETVSKYLTPDEYKKLSSTEKYQLALERYLNRKNKSLWLIGISYERYVGYLYETRGYNVEYTGALQGIMDEGCDLIAEDPKEKLIIQCKYWRKERVIHENVVLQLYGTMVLKKLDSNKTVKGLLITSTTLSENAKRIANALDIKVVENVNFDKTYPCIKCNINKGTKEKIYHLPFDQQYDRIKIDLKKGEKYVETVAEGEEKGFRRAKKHYYES